MKKVGMGKLIGKFEESLTALGLVIAVKDSDHVS
jgi:hypothetical protein